LKLSNAKFKNVLLIWQYKTVPINIGNPVELGVDN